MGRGNGRAAEAAVARWLTRRGWRVVARNWRGGGGELDLVALRGTLLAVVEVKARADAAALEEPIRAAQAARLHRAADAYLSRHPHDGEVRMDLAAVRRLGPVHRVRIVPGGAGP
jgi:putative endonuclease